MLKLGTDMNSGQMDHLYSCTGLSCPAADCLSFCFFIFLSLQISNIKNFHRPFSGTVRPRRLKLVTHMNIGWMYRIYQNQVAAAYSCLYSFFFLSNFQTLKILSHFSQELWVLESWNLLHTWTVDGCIFYITNRLLLLICPFISFFFPIF